MRLAYVSWCTFKQYTKSKKKTDTDKVDVVKLGKKERMGIKERKRRKLSFYSTLVDAN